MTQKPTPIITRKDALDAFRPLDPGQPKKYSYEQKMYAYVRLVMLIKNLLPE